MPSRQNSASIAAFGLARLCGAISASQLCSKSNRVAHHFHLDDSEWLRRSERRLGSAELLAAIVATQRELATADLDLRRVHQLVCRRAQQLTEAEGAAVVEIAEGAAVLHAGCGILSPLLGA